MATKVAEHTRGMSRSDFNSNEPVIDLVTKKLENIGEAVKWITKNFTEFAEVHSNVTWSKLARTRDKLAHVYFEIDRDLLWTAAQNDIPLIHREIKQIIALREANKAAAMRAQNHWQRGN